MPKTGFESWSKTHQNIHLGIHKAQFLIREAQEELEKLRKKCKHPSYFVGTWEWGGIGRTYLAQICDCCLLSIREATEEERKKHQEEEKLRQREFLQKQGLSPDGV